VDTLDERVGGDHQILAGRWSQDGPIVADSQHDSSRAARLGGSAQLGGSARLSGAAELGGVTRLDGRARAIHRALDACDQVEFAEVP
jgi:hypothetical protein